MIESRRATAADAYLLAVTRQKVWDTTYRGIYPDESIDGFDYAWHTNQDQKRIAREDIEVYLVMDGVDCVGYYTFGNIRGDGRFWLMSLYLLSTYQHLGLGKRIFSAVCGYGKAHGHSKLYLECSPHNRNAVGFYLHMGGNIAAMDCGHENPQEDSYYFEFTL